MAFDYRQVRDIYDTLHSAGVVTDTLPDWSTEMNRLSGTDLYSAGLHDNLIKRASVGIDRLLEKTGLPELSAGFGRTVGESVGAPDAGERIGHGLPRMGLNLASFLIPGAGWANAARLGIAGALSGAEAYTESGSPLSGLLSGATVAAVPGVIAPLERAVLARTGSKLAAFGAGQLGAAGAFEASGFGQDVVGGRPLHDPFTVENLLNLTLGQVPFAALHVGGRILRGGIEAHAVDTATKTLEERQAQEALNNRTPIEQIPDADQTATPEIIAQTKLTLAKLRGEQVKVGDQVKAGLMTPEDGLEATNKLLQEEGQVVRNRDVLTGQTVFGDSIQPGGERTELLGREIRRTDKWRAIKVSDDPANPEELRGKIIGYSTAYEPAPGEVAEGQVGHSKFSLPERQWWTVKTEGEWQSRFKKPIDLNQPTLPVQERPATDEERFAHIEELKKVEVDADAANTPADLQSSVVRLQEVEHQNGLPPTNDATLKKLATVIENSGLVEPQNVAKTAVKAQAKKVARILSEQTKAESTPKKVDQNAATVADSLATAQVIAKQPEVIDHAPIKVLLDEIMSGAITRQDALDSFAKWQKDNPQIKTTFQDESDRFQIFWTLRVRGAIGKDEVLSPGDVDTLYDELKKFEVAPENKDELKDFPSRLYVQEFDDSINERIARVKEGNAAPKLEIPAGDGWLFSMGRYDPSTNTLNVKHRLPNTGELGVAQFRNMAGAGKPLTAAEIDLYRVIVPEAFDGEKVNVPKLWEGLKTKGPVVEVKKLGQDMEEASQYDKLTLSRGELVHQLETEFPGYRLLGGEGPLIGPDGKPFNRLADEQEVIYQALPSRLKELVEQVSELSNQISTLDDASLLHDDNAAQYVGIAPKSPSEMPGYVEGLVKLPSGNDIVTKTEAQYGDPESFGENEGVNRALDQRAGVRYRGPHFGSEDTNVLAFYRGYEETLPDGTKAFHVIEVQSDWGQSVRDRAKTIATRTSRYEEGELLPHELDAAKHIQERESHPLLRVYESLALKAAIAHAKSVGATKVILSDAETAMMTEGHDRQINTRYFPTEEGAKKFLDDTLRMQGGNVAKDWKIVANPTGGSHEKWTIKMPIRQEKGMRLHYDQTLPSAMERLTGQDGVPVDVGVHKAANVLPEGERLGIREVTPPGSPVFRDASGNPKTQITGRLYDISNTPDTFSLTDPNRAPQDRPFLPETPEDVAVLKQLGNDGHSAVKFLSESSSPTVRALAADLGKFTSTLGRIEVEVKQTASGGSRAYDLGGGKTRIVISHAQLDGRTQMEFNVAHELVHGLTLSELNNPTKVGFVKEFDDMRARLVETLPRAQRDALNDAIASGWYNKWGAGQVEFRSLFPEGTAEQRSVMYALLKTKEMVAQGLSSLPVQKFMRGVKSDRGNWFSRFTNTLRNMLGFKVEGTVMEEFLSKTDQLLEHGNFVSSFSDFSERYFGQLGMTDGQVQANTRRALGVVLNSGPETSTHEVLNQIADTGLIRSSEFQLAQRDARRMFNEKGVDFETSTKILDELGYTPDLRGLDDLTHESLLGLVSNHSDVLDILPESASKYVFSKIKDMQNILGVLKAATNEGNTGLLNLADPSVLRGPVAEGQKFVDKILAVSKWHDEAQTIVEGLHAIEPDGYISSMMNSPENAPVWLEDADKTKRGLGGWIRNFLEPVGQLVRSNPATAEAFAKGFQLQANSRKMQSEGMKSFGIDLKNPAAGLTHESVKQTTDALANPKVAKAVSDWMYWNQKKGKDNESTQLLPDSDSDVAKALANLSAKERSDVTDVISKQVASMTVMQGQTLEKMLQIAATNGAVVASKDNGLKVGQNITLSDTLLSALVADRNDPVQNQQANAQISLVQSKMTPEGFLNLLKYTQGEAEKYSLWKQHFASNPAWASGQRYGKYLVEFVRGKRTFLAGVESRKEAETLSEGGKITKFERNQKDEEDRPPVLGPDSVGVITRLRELEQNQLDILRNALSPEDIQQLRQTSPVEQFATEEAYRGGVPSLRPPARGLTKGAEELPWLQNHFSWVQKTSTFWSRQLLRAQARAHLLDPEIAQVPELQKKLKTHFDNMLHPDTQTGQFLNKFVSTWFMGFNPASAIVNATQPFLTHIAELTSLTGKPLDSYRRVLSAMSELSGHGVARQEWRTPEHAKLIHDASQDGELDYSMFDDQAAAQESIATNYKRVLAGNRPQTLGQRLSTGAGAYSTAGMWMFRGVERINNMSALLSSFDYYREQGLSYDGAYEKAKEFNHAVNYGGGRAQRPIGAFSGRGAFPRTVAMTATALQNYVLGTTFQLSRYIRAGFFRPEGITPHEVYSARKAAVQMLGTQLVAAGVLGLPFVSGALALLDKAFPDLELNKRLRESVSDLFASDKENGSVLSDAAMTGIPSMFGWDLQSRLSMGNTVPGVSEVNGFQPELLLGAPANLVSTFVKGTTQLATGNVGAAVQSFLPSALKKSVQLASTGGTVKDYRGRPLFQPSVGETAGILLGFQPKRLSDFNAASRIAQQNQDVHTRREGQFRQGLAEEVLKGNFGTVRQTLLDRSQSDKSYDPVEAVRAIARSASELTFPRDLRREGTRQSSPERQRLLSAFNLERVGQPSEVDRLKFQQQVAARLGLHSQDRREQSVATIVDQLRQQQPDATRSELRRQAELFLRHGRTQTLIPESQ